MVIREDIEFAEAVARTLADLRRNLIERSKPLEPDIQQAIAARMDELYEPCHSEPGGSRAARTGRR